MGERRERLHRAGRALCWHRGGPPPFTLSSSLQPGCGWEPDSRWQRSLRGRPQWSETGLPCSTKQLPFPDAERGWGRGDSGLGTAASVHIPGSPEGLRRLLGKQENLQLGPDSPRPPPQTGQLSPSGRHHTASCLAGASRWHGVGRLPGSGEGPLLSCSPRLESHPELCS